MPTTVPGFPPNETLIRFLTERASVSISEASALVGFSMSWVLKKAETEHVDLANGEIPWEDVMTWMLRAWPLTIIEDALAPEDRGLLPRLLGTAPVTWRLPRYIVMAMEHQAELARRAGDAHAVPVEQYVADRLYEAIEVRTADELGPEFRDAFLFPEGEG